MPIWFATAHWVFGGGAPERLSSRQVSDLRLGNPVQSVTGVAFYAGRLYAATTAALVETADGSNLSHYLWSRTGSVVEGPWVDRANGLLWVGLPDRGELARFDGKRWVEVSSPKPRRGYVTRGEALTGLVGISDKTRFWMVGAGRAWNWNAARAGRWVEETELLLASAPRGLTRLRTLVPSDDVTYFVLHDDHEPSFLLQDVWRDMGWLDRLHGDAVYCRTRDGDVLPTNLAGKFFVVQAVRGNHSAYLRTSDGGVVQASNGSVARVPAPAFCEALATASGGDLIGSFRGKGIFRLAAGWHRVLEPPPHTPPGERLVCLACEGNCIAVGIHPLPEPSGSAARFFPAEGLWYANDTGWKQIPLPEGRRQ